MLDPERANKTEKLVNHLISKAVHGKSAEALIIPPDPISGKPSIAAAG